MRNVTKLAKFFDNELRSGLKNIIITYKDNRCELFGRYTIERNDGLYKAVDVKTKEHKDFLSLKHAVSYCTLLDAGKYPDSQRLRTLDLKLSSLETDMLIHKKLLKKAGNNTNRELYINKLQEDSYQRKLVIEEINLYINNSKNILVSKLNQNFK